MKRFSGLNISDDEGQVVPILDFSRVSASSDGENSFSPPSSPVDERENMNEIIGIIRAALQDPTDEALWEDVQAIPAYQLNNIVQICQDDFTILHVAALYGDSRFVSLCLANSAQRFVDVIDDRPEGKNSPLTYAVRSCKREAVELLLPYSRHRADALCVAIVQYEENTDLESDLRLHQKEMLDWLFTRPEIVGSDCVRDYPAEAPKIKSCVNFPHQLWAVTALQLAVKYRKKALFLRILSVLPERRDAELLPDSLPLDCGRNITLDLAVSGARPYNKEDIDFIVFLLSNFPSWARCPITGGIMVHPVRAADGCIYEWVAIRQLMSLHPMGPVISPVTGLPLERFSVTREEALEVSIQKWIKTRHEADRLKYVEIAKQYDQASAAVQANYFGSPCEFFDRFPTDLRNLLIHRYFGNFGEVDKKHLAEAKIRGVSIFFNRAIEPAKAKIAEYFDHMITGNFKAAEAMLKKDPGLSVARLTITDLSARVFKDITGFQYSVYARFTGIPKTIASYMTVEQAKKQFQQQMDPENENTKEHGPLCLAVDEWGQKWGEAIHKKYGNMDIEEICKWAEQFLKDLQERVGPEQASQTMRIMMESEQERKEIGWFKCVLQFYEDITDVLGGVQAKQTAEVRMRMLEEGEEAGWLSGDVQKEVPWTEDSVSGWSAEKCGFWWRGSRGFCRQGMSYYSDLAYDASIIAKIQQNQERELAELESLYGVGSAPSFGQKGQEQ